MSPCRLTVVVVVVVVWQTAPDPPPKQCTVCHRGTHALSDAGAASALVQRLRLFGLLFSSLSLPFLGPPLPLSGCSLFWLCHAFPSLHCPCTWAGMAGILCFSVVGKTGRINLNLSSQELKNISWKFALTHWKNGEFCQ